MHVETFDCRERLGQKRGEKVPMLSRESVRDIGEARRDSRVAHQLSRGTSIVRITSTRGSRRALKSEIN
ncbi:unnamed protein product [Ectocarpus sp. 8 AP-2014]